MNTLARWLFCLPMILAAVPAQAQTYGSTFPVCLQTFGIGGSNIDCSYVSMDQCRASASGRAAECITNPYFSGIPFRTSGSRHRR
jgi:Protein of unknown function (DUF3551)